MNNYFYKPVWIFSILLIFFFLLYLLNKDAADATYLLGTLICTAIIGTVISLGIGLVRKILNKIDTTLSPAPTNTTPRSMPFKIYGIFTQILGFILIPFGLFISLLFATGGPGAAPIIKSLILIFVSGGLALIVYGNGIRTQKNWIIPFWILGMLYSISKNIMSFFAGEDKTAIMLQHLKGSGLQESMPYLTNIATAQKSPSVIFGGLVISLFVIYKIYLERTGFSGRYFSVGSVFFIIFASVALYSYFILFHTLPI